MADLRDDPDPRARVTPAKIAAAVVLAVAIVVPLLVSSYDRVEPRLWGFPFFYWYQLAWVFLAAAACAIAFFLLRHDRAAAGRHLGQTGERGARTPTGGPR